LPAARRGAIVRRAAAREQHATQQRDPSLDAHRRHGVRLSMQRSNATLLSMCTTVTAFG
jgi:hypothetical protein